MQPGFAAKAGVLSARISALGINGARATFEGKDGLFRSYLRDAYDPGVLREGLGSRYELINLSYKPYPCCRFNHTGIEAALNLRDRLATDTARIERIRVGVNRQAFEAVCTPVEMRSAPRTTVEAQFSLPYTIACAIVKGEVSIADFAPEVLQDPTVVALARKVEAYIDPEIERKWARGVPPARLEVTIAGRSWVEVVEGASGSRDKPFTDRQFADKWRDCLAAGSVDRSDAFVEDLLGLLRALPAVGGLGELFWLVGGEGAVA
jgi:2-methylcitrate dehydratase PrpD